MSVENLSSTGSSSEGNSSSGQSSSSSGSTGSTQSSTHSSGGTSAGGAAGSGSNDFTAVDTGSGATSGAEGQATPEQAAAQAQAAYQVNKKYRVMKEEKEIPEWLVPAIKNAEHEKFVREALEWSGGAPHLKEHAQRVEQHLNQVVQEWQPQVQTLQTANHFLAKKDFDSFFKLANISDNEVLKHASIILDRRDLAKANPDAARSINELPTLRHENMNLQTQFNDLQNQYQTLTVQQRTNDLNNNLAKPEISATVSAFDARIGKPGAFRAEVIRRGQMYAAMGQDIPAEQAIHEVLSLIGPISAPAPVAASASVQGAGTPGQTPEAPAVGAKPPVLPNIGGRGTSPVKKSPKSTDDLRKLAAQMRG
jgi:hypothetical protein